MQLQRTACSEHLPQAPGMAPTLTSCMPAAECRSFDEFAEADALAYLVGEKTLKKAKDRPELSEADAKDTPALDEADEKDRPELGDADEKDGPEHVFKEHLDCEALQDKPLAFNDVFNGSMGLVDKLVNKLWPLYADRLRKEFFFLRRISLRV